MGKILRHDRASGKDSEHSIIGEIKSIMCIGLMLTGEANNVQHPIKY